MREVPLYTLTTNAQNLDRAAGDVIARRHHTLLISAAFET